MLSVPVSLNEPSRLTAPVTRYLLVLFIVVTGCLADLLSKHWIFQWRGMPGASPVWWLWEGYVGIETALNPGALFGMGAAYGRYFALLSVLAAMAICYWIFIWRGAHDDLPLTLALGSILAGILGNLYDRLGMWHPPGQPGQWRTEVRDWILFRYGEWTWPNFNIADCLLVAGAGLLMLHAYRQPTEAPHAEPEA